MSAYAGAAIVDADAGEIRAEGSRLNIGVQDCAGCDQAPGYADDGLSIALNVPGHTHPRRKNSPLGFEFLRKEEARPGQMAEQPGWLAG